MTDQIGWTTLLSWRENGATIKPLQMLLWTRKPNVNSLGPSFISRPIGVLGFRVSLVLDPSVNSPFYFTLDLTRAWPGIGYSMPGYFNVRWWGTPYARMCKVCTGPGRWAPVIIQTARRVSHRVTRPAGPLPPSIMRPAEILPLCLAFRFRVFGVFTPQKVPVKKISPSGRPFTAPMFCTGSC